MDAVIYKKKPPSMIMPSLNFNRPSILAATEKCASQTQNPAMDSDEFLTLHSPVPRDRAKSLVDFAFTKKQQLSSSRLSNQALMEHSSRQFLSTASTRNEADRGANNQSVERQVGLKARAYSFFVPSLDESDIISPRASVLLAPCVTKQHSKDRRSIFARSKSSRRPSNYLLLNLCKAEKSLPRLADEQGAVKAQSRDKSQEESVGSSINTSCLVDEQANTSSFEQATSSAIGKSAYKLRDGNEFPFRFLFLIHI